MRALLANSGLFPAVSDYFCVQLVQFICMAA
jgi:hypothetical protein